MQKNTRVALKSFLGTIVSNERIDSCENYWKLIGEKGILISDEVINERVLVLFDKDLDIFKVENHNPVKNSLWILKTDLSIE